MQFHVHEIVNSKVLELELGNYVHLSESLGDESNLAVICGILPLRIARHFSFDLCRQQFACPKGRRYR